MYNIEKWILEINKELNESINNWIYTIPKDPFEIMMDFYFLSWVYTIETGNEKFDESLSDALNKILNYLKKHMLYSLQYAICSELRHLDQYYHDDKNKNIHNYIHNFLRIFNNVDSQNSRDKVYNLGMKAKKQMNISISEFGEITKELFLHGDWPCSAYGGTAWAQISEGLIKLSEATSIKDKIIWIDHCYDLQHNTDTVFNKLFLYSKGGYEWIGKALDWKNKVQDVREFYDVVSNKLKPIVAYISKNQSNKSMDTFKKKPINIMRWGSEDVRDNKNRDPLVWKNGTWKGGIWYGGIWKNGTWENGTWEDGTWENGIWENGMWHDGTWEKGTWEKGTWENGTWKNGTWKNGKWISGYWEKGTWENGTWKNGKWISGYIYSKKWKENILSGVNPKKFYEIEKKSTRISYLKAMVK